MASLISQSPYPYAPLIEQDGIRLIKLEPSSDQLAPIVCQLIDTTLAKAKADIVDQYTALSYVWGDPSDRRTIYIDGRSIQITVNLDCALRHLRDATRSMYVWADAVCINQSDERERSHQVAQMGTIYKTATHTVIFLGACETETETALTEALESIDAGRLVTGSRKFGSLMVPLLERPWFRRVWIFQELILSRDPRVQYGSFRCSWDEFYWLVERTYRQALVENDPHRGNDHCFWTVDALQSARFFHQSRDPHSVSDGNSEWQRFVNVLTSRRGFGVTDPRDMIFAHTGPFRYLGINIDYGKSIGEIFAELVYEFDSRIRGLELLTHIEDIELDQRRPNTPSWAPDWSSSNRPPLQIKHPTTPQDAKAVRLYTFIPAAKPPLLCSRRRRWDLITRITATLENIKIPDFNDEDEDGNPKYDVWFNSRYQWWQDYFGGGDEILPFSPKRLNHAGGIQLHYAFKGALKADTKQQQQKNILDELMLKRTNVDSIIDSRRVARLSGDSQGRRRLALVPASAHIGDMVVCPAGSSISLVVRADSRTPEPSLDEMVRDSLSPPSSPRSLKDTKVKYARLVGDCFLVDYSPAFLDMDTLLAIY